MSIYPCRWPWWLAAAVVLAGCPSGPVLPSADLAPAATARIHAQPDLVGFVTRLDGLASTGPTGDPVASYAWHFVSVPPRSKIDDRALSSPTAASVELEPDLGGEYQLSLTVVAQNGATDTAVRAFTVPTVPLFYYEGLGGAIATQLGVRVIRSDGSGQHLISCPIVGVPAPDGGNATSPLSGLRFSGLYGIRTWDPPVGSTAPSRNVYLEDVAQSDGTFTDFRLWAGDELTDCATVPAVRIDSTGVTNDHEHFWPRFSADGSRVLYVDKPQDLVAFTYRIVTIGFDKTRERAIRSGMVRFHEAPPVWVDATHVAWVENLSSTSTPRLVIFVASDANQAGDSSSAPGDRTVLLDCDGPGGKTGTPTLTIINQFAIVDGAIIVAGATASPFAKTNPGQFELYRMAPGACTLAKKLAAQPARGFAWDFDVSPDHRTIVFSGGVAPRDLYTVPVDGSTPPVHFGGDPALEDVGPRFLAGGRQITWTQTTDADPPRGGGLMIANADGTHVRSLYAEGGTPEQSTRVVGGTNQGTACGYAGRAPEGLWLLVGAGVLAMALQTRRRARRGDRRR